MRRDRRLLGTLAVLAGGLAGCGGGHSSGASVDGTSREILPPEARTVEQRPGETLTVAEPDICKLDSSTLYVQSAARGLSVIDVSSASRPQVVAELTTLVGRHGELFASNGQVFVVFKESATVPGQAEVVSVVQASTTPTIMGRLDVPGFLVVSRLSGAFIYLVTTNNVDTTWVSEVSIADPRRISVASSLRLDGVATEALVSDRAIYVVQAPSGGTRVRAVDLTDPSGALFERGSISLKGAPQGLFHMDAQGTTFRIVTFGGTSGSNLYVIDTTDLTRLATLGAIEGLGPGETLRATRFVGDRAYVVTYARPVITVTEVVGTGFLGDPVWVVSLADPTHPTVIGELHVPGWSDYLFPRGDRLVAVGRAGMGERVAVALYDVHDPSQPAELSRVEFGIQGASSEANTDYRGVAIVDSGSLGAVPLVAVPYTNNLFPPGGGAGTTENFVQLIDLQPDALVLEGTAPLVGLARRALPVGGLLYAVTEKTVAAIDVSNRATPVIPASVVVGDLAAVEPPIPVFMETPIVHVQTVRVGCEVGPGPSSVADLVPPAVLVVLLALLRRRGRGSRVSAH